MEGFEVEVGEEDDLKFDFRGVFAYSLDLLNDDWLVWVDLIGHVKLGTNITGQNGCHMLGLFTVIYSYL